MNFKKDVSVASWESEKGLAEVTVKKGKMWCSMGVIRSSKLYCNVEEAVYLVGLGSLIMLNDDRIMSIDEIYSLLFIPAHGCSWAAYQAFAYLKRLGYIVGRYDVLWTTSRKQEKFPSFKSVFEMDLSSKAEELILLPSPLESVVKSNSREVQFPISDTMDEVGCDLMLTRTGTESSMNNYPSREEKYGNDAAFLPCDIGRSYHSREDAKASLDSLQSLSVLSLNKDEDTCGLLPMFDVFLPNGRFKKSTPGLPTFRLCISSGQPPKPDELRALEHKVCGIPLKYVVVECGHISIFSFDTVSLPDLP
ncbi:hypothetical protein Mapa_001466 [Marchantia paleacea]|nr:hypothetical protein Mapa_001466 [Marchantia paleacea]